MLIAGRGLRVVILQGLADVGNDVNEPETLRKLSDSCGVEGCAGDEDDLVTGDRPGVHGAKEETSLIEDDTAKAVARPGGVRDEVLVVVLRQRAAIGDELDAALVSPGIHDQPAGKILIGSLVVGE